MQWVKLYDIPPFHFFQNLYKKTFFNRYFKNDFIKVAGFVAEQIYTGKNNKTGAGGDLEEWINVTLLGLPNKHFFLEIDQILI